MTDLTPGPFPKGKGSLLDEQRRLVAYLDGLQVQVAKVHGLQEESARDLDAMICLLQAWNRHRSFWMI
jgi:hypothetical protein